MSRFECVICGKINPIHLTRCDECFRCDDCETKNDLCHYDEGLFCQACHKKRIEKRVSEFNGETTHTIKVICPYCGYEWSDSWEPNIAVIKSEPGKLECDVCGNTFKVCRQAAITYTTSKT